MVTEWMAFDHASIIHDIDMLCDTLIVMPPHTYFIGYVPPQRSINHSHNYLVAHLCDGRVPPEYLLSIYETDIEPGEHVALDLARQPDYGLSTRSIQGLLLALGRVGTRPQDQWMQMPKEGTEILHLGEERNGA